MIAVTVLYLLGLVVIGQRVGLSILSAQHATRITYHSANQQETKD